MEPLGKGEPRITVQMVATDDSDDAAAIVEVFGDSFEIVTMVASLIATLSEETMAMVSLFLLTARPNTKILRQETISSKPDKSFNPRQN